VAQYKVQAPDGSIMTLEGPDGAAEADILKAAEELYQPSSGFGQKALDLVGEGFGAVGEAAGALVGTGREAMHGFQDNWTGRAADTAEQFGEDWERAASSGANWKAGANAIAGIPGQSAAGLMAVPGLAEQAIFGEDPAALNELVKNFERRSEDWSWHPFKGEDVANVQQEGMKGFESMEKDITDNIVTAAGITNLDAQNAVQSAVRYTLEMGLPGEVAIRHIISKMNVKPSKALLDHIQGIYDKIEYAKRAEAKKKAEVDAYEALQRELDEQDPTAPQYGRGDLTTPPELEALNREYQAPMEGVAIPEMSQKATRASLREAGEGAGLGIAERLETAPEPSAGLEFQPWRSPEDKMAYPTPDVVEKAGRAGPEPVDLAKRAEITTAAKTLYEKIERALRGEKMAQRWRQRGAVSPELFTKSRSFDHEGRRYQMFPRGEIPEAVMKQVGDTVNLDFVKKKPGDYVSMVVREGTDPVGYVVFKKVGDALQAEMVRMKDGYHGADRMYEIFQQFADIDRSLAQSDAGVRMWEKWREQGKTTREGTRRPLGGTGKKGFGQGGALSMEPIKNLFEARKARKFQQFKDAVREEFGHAYSDETIQTAWDMLKEQPVDPVFTDFHNEEVMRTALGQGLEDYSSAPPDPTKLEEVFDRTSVKDLDPGNVKKFFRAAVSGLAYLGRITNHPLIKAGGIATQRAHFLAQARTRKWIGKESPLYAAMTDLRKSGLENKKIFLDVLKEHEGLKDLTDADLRRYPEKVATALREYRKVSKEMYDALKQGNDAFGIITRPYREGWAPGIFKGRYYVSGTLDGKNAGWFWADSKRQLKKMIPELERMYPDMKFGLVQDSLRGKWDKAQEHGAVMMTLEHIMDSFDAADPKMNQIRSAIQRMLEGDPMTYVGRHGRTKKGVEGAIGFEPHKSTKKNFDNFVVHFLGYAENLAKYAEYGQMDKYIKEITDSSRFRHQAEAQAAIKAVWERNFLGKPSELGAKLNVIADSMSAIVGELPGMDANSVRKLNQISKKAFFSILFGFYNIKFLATQMFQPAQFISATYAEIAAKMNANPLSMTKAITKGMGDSIMSAFNEGGLSKEMRDALAYAEKHGVFDPMFIEQFETFGESLINNKTVEWVTGAEMIRLMEAKARKHFFIQAYHAVKEAGIKDAAKAADLAANFTNEKMVNYAPQFRPLLYTTLGPVGQLLSPLTTFKHNYYSQLAQVIAESSKAGVNPTYVIPVAMMLLSQILFAGLYGLPLVQEYETVVDVLKDQGVIDRQTNAKLSDVITDPTRLANAGFTENLALTGIFNAAFGLDFQASFAAAEFVPRNIAPVVGMAYEAFRAANKDNSSGWEAVADKLMPRGPLRYLWEEQYTDEEGNFYDPKKSKHPLVYRRGQKERLANLLGARTVEESYERRRNFEKEKRKDIRENEKKKYVSEFRSAYIKGDETGMEEAAVKILELPGGETTLKNLVKEAQQELTPQEKTARAALNGSEQAIEDLMYLMGN